MSIYSQVPGSVVIDCFPERAECYRNGFAVVPVDVIRATTTAVTAVSLGRRCFPVANVAQALAMAATLDQPLLVGEVGGDTPEGFDLPNSPAQLAQHNDLNRPMILLSSSGTRTIVAAKGAAACYLGCLRNYSALVTHLAAHHPKVAVIGAGTRGEFREEDQLCCAWIGRGLLQAGYRPADDRTAQIIRRWENATVQDVLISNSVAYLRRTGQLHDLDFILSHVDDLRSVFELQGDEVVVISAEADARVNLSGLAESKAPEHRLNAAT